MQKNGFPTWLVILLILLVLCLLVVCIGAVVFWRTTSIASVSTQVVDLATQADVAATQPGEGGPGSSGGQGETLVLGASPVIYLAGRTDIQIPPLDTPSDQITEPLFFCRDSAIVQEVRPFGFRVQPGAQVQFQATGRINFYGGEVAGGYPPDGDAGGSQAFISSYGGLSGYIGPAGALLGVFIDGNIPVENPPAPLNFGSDSANGEVLGVDFERLAPGLGQVFFIGDGRNATGQSQVFIAPAGATRLFVGLADGSGFYGPPTCYADNTGSFEFKVEAEPALIPIP